MKKPDLTKLSKEALLIEQKKSESNLKALLIILGIMIGIAIFTTVRNGLGFFSFFPLIWIFLALALWSTNKEIKDEIESRNQKE